MTDTIDTIDKKVFICTRCKKELNMRVLHDENEKPNYLIKDGNLFCDTYCARVYRSYVANNKNNKNKK